MSLRFDGQTVLITGAGHGLGPDIAISLAKLGANVVVHHNDHARASQITARVRAAGSHALADSTPFCQGERIIATILAKFGNLHAIIFNAGCPSNSSWAVTERIEWDELLGTTFKGSYKVQHLNAVLNETRGADRHCFLGPATCVAAFQDAEAWKNLVHVICYPHEQARLLRASVKSVSSPAFASDALLTAAASLYGQLGFIQTIAKEGVKYNIFASVLSPAHSIGLVQGVSEPEVEHFTTAVATLIHPSNITETGHLYEVEHSRLSKLRWQRASGAILKPGPTMTPSSLIEKWNDINDFSQSEYPSTTADLPTLLAKANASPSNPASKEVRLDGRVALITGAGSGLGREYAKCLANLGAYVILNDIKEATDVSAELRRAGVVHHNVTCSVEEGEKAVAETIQKYGRIDIVVNNAGFVRDKSIGNMTDGIWDSVTAVHLKGTFRVTTAAWPYMVKQGYGRVVNVSSTSGIYGNFGQANYSTAKCAIIGFSEALAREGAKHNILVNAIAPVASTAALAVAVKDAGTTFSAEYCAPLVAALCLNSVPYPSTGLLFELAVGWHARTRLQASHGSPIPRFDDLMTEIASKFLKDVADYDHFPPRYPEDAEYGLRELARQIPQFSTLQRIEDAKARKSHGTTYEYGDKEVMFYNLSLGARWTELPLIHENDKHFQALPTFGAIPYFNSKTPFTFDEILPNWDPTKLLHGEHYLEIRKRPIPTSGKLVTYPHLIDVIDKKKAAVVVVGNITRDATTAEDVFYNEFSAYVRGAGGFSKGNGINSTVDPGSASENLSCPPDFTRDERTTEEQAAFYRLNGDRNIMHIDPVTAAQAGFSRPILHGLCFFGIAGKHVYQRYGAFKNIRVRFASTVNPGQTLRSEMWNENDVVLFQMRVVETGTLCISGGRAELVKSMGMASRL